MNAGKPVEKFTTLKVSKTYHKKIKQYAANHDSTIEDVTNLIMTDWFKKQEKKQDSSQTGGAY